MPPKGRHWKTDVETVEGDLFIAKPEYEFKELEESPNANIMYEQ